MAEIKVALGVPCHDRVHSKWTQSLLDMIIYTTAPGRIRGADGEPLEVTFAPLFVSSSDLAQSRTRIAAEAVMADADYLLWLDSDHVFAEDSFCRLWARGKDIVGVNYARRCIPTAPTGAKKQADDPKEDHEALVYTTKEKAEANELEEVAHLGFGMVLMRTEVFDRLQLHAEEQGKASMMPLFQFGVREDGMTPIGEDVFFFQKCREAGLKVWCDHGVSESVGHLTEFIMLNAHACAQASDWVKQTASIRERLAEAAEAA